MGGYKKIKPTDGNTFSSTNQPSGELKSKGKKKARLLRQVASQLIQGELKNNLSPLAIHLGIDPNLITVEMALHMKQMQNALDKGDTQAYNAVMNRMLGKVKEQIEINDISNKKPDSILKFKDYDNGNKQ